MFESLSNKDLIELHERLCALGTDIAMRGNLRAAEFLLAHTIKPIREEPVRGLELGALPTK